MTAVPEGFYMQHGSKRGFECLRGQGQGEKLTVLAPWRVRVGGELNEDCWTADCEAALQLVLISRLITQLLPPPQCFQERNL